MATVDDVMARLKANHGAEIQEALDWQATDGGELDFTVGINRRPKEEIDKEQLYEDTRPEALLARIKALEEGKVDGGK
jgi:hypothetical protein